MLSIGTWICLIGAALIAGLSPFLLRPLLRKAGIIDAPNHRSSHFNPTLRGGGTAQLLAIALGGGLGAITLDGDDAMVAGLITSASVAVGVVGLLEDLRGLRVAVRLGLQLAIGVILGSLLSLVMASYWTASLLTMVGFAAYVNFANFMDGLNGISSLHGLITGLAYATLGLLLDHTWIVLAGFLIAAAFAAFLPWNFMPPGMFLGDVGSYLLGGSLASISIASVFAGIHPIAAAAPLAIYLADTLATLLRRVGKKEPLHRAHRQHVYQRLTETGLSHVAVSSLVAVFTILTSAIGLLVASNNLSVSAAVLSVGAVVGLYLSLPSLRRNASHISPEEVDV